MPITAGRQFDDYDRFTSGLDDFLGEARSAGIGERIHTLAPGEVMDLATVAALR